MEMLPFGSVVVLDAWLIWPCSGLLSPEDCVGVEMLPPAGVVMLATWLPLGVNVITNALLFGRVTLVLMPLVVSSDMLVGGVNVMTLRVPFTKVVEVIDIVLAEGVCIDVEVCGPDGVPSNLDDWLLVSFVDAVRPGTTMIKVLEEVTMEPIELVVVYEIVAVDSEHGQDITTILVMVVLEPCSSVVVTTLVTVDDAGDGVAVMFVDGIATVIVVLEP